jgi:glycosyltransferase involved in cell wall biosynthesis
MVGYIADWSPSAAYGVPAGDERALADGIVTLLGNPALRERLAREAGRLARAQDAEWSAKAIEGLYNAGLQRR